MALKLIEEQVPGGLENYYEPTDDGKFRLKVEGVVEKSVVDSLQNELKTLKDSNKEFRDNNLSLKRKMETVTGLFGEGEKFDPNKLDERIEGLVTPRLESKIAEYKQAKETEISQLQEKFQTTNRRLYDLILGNEVTKAATTHGVLGSALTDVSRRAQDAFDVVDGILKPKSDKLTKDGKELTVDDWMAGLRNEAPHLFERSNGTNASMNFKPIKNNGRETEKRSGVEMIAAGLNNSRGQSKPLHS